jgi:hypothetical protein
VASTRLAHLIMADCALIPASVLGTPRDSGAFDMIVPPGHKVVDDGRVWSCKSLTAEERQLVGDRHLDTVMAAPNSEQSCLVKNTEGEPVFLRQREIVPGSFLVTRSRITGVNLLQTLNFHPNGIATLTSANGGSIQLPKITVTYRREFWKDGDPVPTSLSIK